jgi:MinD-like ATPase involved in chromosome partitioning or flagellar assembly
VRDLLQALPGVHSYMDVRRYTSQVGGGLEVLANDPDPASAASFDESGYRRVLHALGRQYPLVLTDSGTGLGHSAMRGILAEADQLIIVSMPSVDGADSAALTLNYLAARGHADLVARSIAVVSAVRSSTRPVRLDEIVAYFTSRCRAVLTVPYDEHLATGGEFDPDRLRPRTRAAYRELAAKVAEGFPGQPAAPPPTALPPTTLPPPTAAPPTPPPTAPPSPAGFGRSPFEDAWLAATARPLPRPEPPGPPRPLPVPPGNPYSSSGLPEPTAPQECGSRP